MSGPFVVTTRRLCIASTSAILGERYRAVVADEDHRAELSCLVAPEWRIAGAHGDEAVTEVQEIEPVLDGAREARAGRSPASRMVPAGGTSAGRSPCGSASGTRKWWISWNSLPFAISIASKRVENVVLPSFVRNAGPFGAITCCTSVGVSSFAVNGVALVLGEVAEHAVAAVVDLDDRALRAEAAERAHVVEDESGGRPAHANAPCVTGPAS